MNENNSNGNGEGKSLAEMAVHRRQEVRKKTDVSDAAKLLFDDLTDVAFLAKHQVGFGVVRIGKPLLAERLGKSIPTITRAQKELTPGELWTKTSWHDGHEITIWFLRGIADGQLEFDQFTEGVTKTPRTRIAPRVPPIRGGHGQFCKAGGNSKTQQIELAPSSLTGGHGQSCRLATVNSDGATPSSLTVGHGQICRAGPVKIDRSERSNLTVATGQIHRGGPVTDDRGRTAEMTGYKKDSDIKDGGSKAAHTPLPRYELLDSKAFLRIRQTEGPKMIERIRERILGLENSRRPLPQQKEIIAVHKARIREIKNWMDGIVPEQKTAAVAAA